MRDPILRRPAAARVPARGLVPALRRTALLAAAAAAATALAQQADPGEPPGADKTARTRLLEAGAALLQRHPPLAALDIHLVGLHPMKAEPQHQMLAHHHCRQVNQDFAQCVLFDGPGRDARLTGVEYIISAALFATLPAAERAYWHPHNGEILSGQLVAPGLPQAAEKALMRDKLGSYGKTWHLWDTGAGAGGQPGLPLGPPMLAWSFNRDGEVQPELLRRHEQALDYSSAERRRQRADLQPLARPQHGVDALRSAFPQARPIPGVSEAAPAAAAATSAPAPPASR